ncbi:hypothetical protein [Rothia mucilaginosa]|uniref:hypothetical protein n=2 Tax=Rothia mucilaginosa TaxID=43675 RepID=UPI00066A22C8|nr:hypothetical protein [Rothia mucilaginosa]
MGIIVDPQPGDGFLIKVSDSNDGKGGTELLVLEVAAVEGSLFSARLLNSARLDLDWKRGEEYEVFIGKIIEDDPLRLELKYYDSAGELVPDRLESYSAIYLGAPVKQTRVTLTTEDGYYRHIVCRSGDDVLTWGGSRIVKAVYEGMVVVDNHSYVYLDAPLHEKLGVNHWPECRHRQTWNFAGAVAQILPITIEVASALDSLRQSAEYASLQESHPELWDWRRYPNLGWFYSEFPSVWEEPYPGELVGHSAPHILLDLVDSGRFFRKDHPYYSFEEPDDFLDRKSGERTELMLNATRAVTDRLEALADLLREKTVDTTPYEALLRENVARLKETKEYICTGVPNEKSRAHSFYGGYSPPFGKCRELW